MKRTSLALAWAAVLLLAVPFLAACSGEGERRPTTPVAVTSTPVPEPLTRQVAEREFRAYVNNDDVARASGDERLALNWVSDGQAQLIASEFRKAAFDGEPVPRYEYRKTTLYVPKLETETYPHWFVAVAERVQRPVAGQTAGEREPETAIMALIRRSADTPWQLSLATVLSDKARIPKIAVDDEGYAEALSTTDGSLLISPKSLPGIQSAIAEEGPDSVPARLMEPGAATTGLYRDSREVREKAREDGLVSNPVFPATLFPIFALRTADKGGLVLYALSRDTQTYVEDHKGIPPVPRDAEHMLDEIEYGNELHVIQTLQFAAYDPPKDAGKGSGGTGGTVGTGGTGGAGKNGADGDEGDGRRKADVIAGDGAVTRAVANKVKTP